MSASNTPWYQTTYMKSFTGENPFAYCREISVTAPVVPEFRKRYHANMQTTGPFKHQVFVSHCIRGPLAPMECCPHTEYGDYVGNLGYLRLQKTHPELPDCVLNLKM
ncbi:uncharacterized protein LOC129758528 [Uranotaenia lowii]|uniref:uncharacterized protein LOC129758528 n=1 Tax=Uranotaenia lowii TaxID=190385 RepID=UPI002479FF40|nr:uncharacterized protein LOC129758528 [Uranotaenia lowii]